MMKRSAVSLTLFFKKEGWGVDSVLPRKSAVVVDPEAEKRQQSFKRAGRLAWRGCCWERYVGSIRPVKSSYRTCKIFVTAGIATEERR